MLAVFVTLFLLVCVYVSRVLPLFVMAFVRGVYCFVFGVLVRLLVGGFTFCRVTCRFGPFRCAHRASAVYFSPWCTSAYDQFCWPTMYTYIYIYIRYRTDVGPMGLRSPFRSPISLRGWARAADLFVLIVFPFAAITCRLAATTSRGFNRVPCSSRTCVRLAVSLF